MYTCSMYCISTCMYIMCRQNVILYIYFQHIRDYGSCHFTTWDFLPISQYIYKYNCIHSMIYIRMYVCQTNARHIFYIPRHIPIYLDSVCYFPHIKIWPLLFCHGLPTYVFLSTNISRQTYMYVCIYILMSH